MKFLCVTCDEPMKLTRADPPDTGGSIAALFACPTCSHQVAMLTNAHETQVVQSLGVRIGPAATAAATAAERAEQGGCPFAAMIGEPSAGEAAGESAGSELAWTAAAEQRLLNVPEFVRPMARQGIEHFARTEGHRVVDEAVMEEARDRFGM